MDVQVEHGLAVGGAALVQDAQPEGGEVSRSPVAAQVARWWRGEAAGRDRAQVTAGVAHPGRCRRGDGSVWP